MDHHQIQICIDQIEKKLGWGSSSHWTNQDFELLSEEILKKTGTNLSITTLKRIWGKVDYQSQPSISTLNVLAQYLKYDHWRDFQSALTNKSTPETQKNSNKFLPILKKFLRKKVAIILVFIIAVSSLFFFIDRRQVFFKADEVVFESKKVSEGLPNTVVFNYDVSTVIADSFHIQQSWDPRRRVRVSPLETKHTSFYYYPGYFHAKLIANDQVIKQHDVFVESNGWIAMIERFPEPIYVNEYLKKNDQLSLNLQNFEQADDLYQDKDFWVDYYFVQDLGDVDADNFEYQCSIRNLSEHGSVCHESRISIITTYGRFNIPLCIPGCVSNLNLTLGDKFFYGKEYDLSALGCDLTQWTDFKLKVVDKKCQISINDSTVFEDSYHVALGKIVGFKFKFNGEGEVDNMLLVDQNQEIKFQESF